MRTRQALAPALLATLLFLIPALAPSLLLSAQPLPILRDVTQEAGLNLVTTCGTPQKKFIIEGNGSGCAWIDYDNDGWTDLYVVNGISSAALMAGREDAASAPNFLFRNGATALSLRRPPKPESPGPAWATAWRRATTTTTGGPTCS